MKTIILLSLLLPVYGVANGPTTLPEPNIDHCINLIHTDYETFKNIGCNEEETNSHIMQVKEGTPIR